MDLAFKDKCTIVDLDNQIIDQETGDTTNAFICQNQNCDYQPARTENVNGTLIARNPKLFLPYNFEYTKLLSRNLTVIISRFRKIAYVTKYEKDDSGITMTLPIKDENGNDVTYTYNGTTENGEEVSYQYTPQIQIPEEYVSMAQPIDFKKDYRQGNPDKKHLVCAKIEDWWEIDEELIDGIQIELREVTYL